MANMAARWSLLTPVVLSVALAEPATAQVLTALSSTHTQAVAAICEPAWASPNGSRPLASHLDTAPRLQ